MKSCWPNGNTGRGRSKMTKKYRVNGSELFNLQSMYEHLKAKELEMEEAPRGTVSIDEFSKLCDRLEELECLMQKAPNIGALVDWNTLKRIREITAERQMIRYSTCLAAGATEAEAAISLQL